MEIFYWIYWFIDLLDLFICSHTNLFSQNKYEKNDEIILTYFQSLKKVKWKESIALCVKNIENLKILKYHIFSIKH